MFTTGGVVSGDNLAVRWAQTSTLGSPNSDFFGFDNVTLDAVAVVPEPDSMVLCAFGALIILGSRMRGARPTPALPAV